MLTYALLALCILALVTVSVPIVAVFADDEVIEIERILQREPD